MQAVSNNACELKHQVCDNWLDNLIEEFVHKVKYTREYFDDCS
jgi:hypothetical protein